MRARYAAYALGDTDFLLDTWHPEHRPAVLNLQDGTRYVGLKIHEVQGPEVEFTATLKLATGEPYLLRERSFFQVLGGRWVYVSEVNAPRSAEVEG